MLLYVWGTSGVPGRFGTPLTKEGGVEEEESEK